MLTNVDKNIFLNSSSIELTPVVSAEWNQNLFNKPYTTIAGTGIKETIAIASGYTVASVTGTNAKYNFTTKSFVMSGGKGDVAYNVTTGGGGNAYKIVTYVMTDNASPVMLNAYAKGTSTQFGSKSIEVNSFGWTKIETIIGSSGTSDAISSFKYTMSFNAFSTDQVNPTIYYTVPEVYQTTFFDYQYGSMWPTDSVFTHFRPGESYVPSGDSKFHFPTDYRKVNTSILSGYTAATYSPVTSITQNPSFTFASSPVPIFKSLLPSNMSQYQYFVSDTSSKNITGIYEQGISANKIVIKLNTIMTTPTINVAIDGSLITVDGSTSIAFPSSQSSSDDNPNIDGVLILYWTGTAWSKTKWTTMPKFGSDGVLSKYTSFQKITITQISKVNKTEFNSISNSSVVDDLLRMHVVEISPRLEVDLTDFVKDVSINKSLDSKNNFVPISSINTDDASIGLSAIPLYSNNLPIPLFSSQSNLSVNILSNMLRKNIKFYINFNVKSYFNTATGAFTPINTYVPGGIFYSDSWNETDIKDVKIQCFDITRYLQTTPVPDYVGNLKSVFDIITNVLDMAGFTDYDYDSLYSICNDKAMPLDLAYYYCNSKDTTIQDALAQIFLAYQIGAYIDEYGIMKFKSLANILSSGTSVMSISDAQIVESGYSITNKAKPGKISLRYQSPKIKQSLALQNATRPDIKNSPSFVYTTSNDVVWKQESVDSVGFNYLNANMAEKDNLFKINNNDLLDIFHTFSLNNNGYAMIENEIVSFVYKQYTLSNGSGSTTVSVKNDIELSSEINKFIKKYQSGLVTSDGTTKADYDVVVTPTGYITDVQRGMFGTSPSAHTLATSLSSKELSAISVASNYSAGSNSISMPVVDSKDTTSGNPSVKKIQVSSAAYTKSLIYPTTLRDQGYKTYSTKFDFASLGTSAAGLFFNLNSTSSTEGAYFVELIKYNQTVDRYCLAVYRVVSGQEVLIAWSDVSGIVTNIINNFEKVLTKTGTGSNYSYTIAQDQAFHIKFVHYSSDGSDGETVGEVATAFINNVEINSWSILSSSSNSTTAVTWVTTDKNTVTKRRKKIMLPTTVSTGSIFGFYASTKPVAISGILFPTVATTTAVANLREIYANQKPLKERSVSYYIQDREFLNSMIQGQNTFSYYQSYMMQTTPEIIGINVYDVQYANPAAVSTDVYWGGYLWQYFPGTQPVDQQFYQKQRVDEYSVSFSTPINTGFRAKMAIANNSSHMVYLTHISDNINQFTNNLTLWTHEIVAPSDPEIIEYVTDSSNPTEVAQVDTPWIQSKAAAYKMLAVIEKGFDGFSKDTTVNIFGNPLIQVGDIITITYSLLGVKERTYLVHSVSQTFNQGLKTTLMLNTLNKGTTY